MFTVITEACICAPEDSWVSVDGQFDSFDSAVAYAKTGKWCGDILRIYYNDCEVAYHDDYGFVMCECSAISAVNTVDDCSDVELPF